MRSKANYLLMILAAMFLMTGCEAKLETGYAPHPLNASDSARRAYYAPAFTPAAMGDKNGEDSGPGLLDH